MKFVLLIEYNVITIFFKSNVEIDLVRPHPDVFLLFKKVVNTLVFIFFGRTCLGQTFCFTFQTADL